MRIKSIPFALLFLLAMCGCAPRIGVKSAPSAPSLASLGEDVLVFGRIRWIENGDEKKKSVELQILRAEDMKKGTIKVKKDGIFFALLPRGTFVIHRFDWWDLWDGPHWIPPKLAFKATECGQAYYLGTVVVNIKAKRDIIGGLWIKGVNISIEDEEGEAMEVFRTRYPEQKISVAKALMIHHPSIPYTDELESQSMLLDLLRSLYFGLMPTLSP